MLRNVVEGDDRTNPKKLLERRYAYFALLALRYRSLRVLRKRQQQQQRLPLTDDDDDGDDDGGCYDRAAAELQSEGVDGMSNRELRLRVQDELTPQVLEALEVFRNVDAEELPELVQLLLFDDDDSGSSDGVVENDDDDDDDPFRAAEWGPCVSVLRQEYARACSELEETKRKRLLRSGHEQKSVAAAADRRAAAFLERKRDAVALLLEFHGVDVPAVVAGGGTARGEEEEDRRRSEEEELGGGDLDDDDNNTPEEDAFGMNTGTISERSLQLMRKYQTVNLVRSALVRERLGYSVLCLKSSIPGAGRGVFLDGRATAGSLLAFLPGEVWPKEHLLTKSADVIEHFSSEEDGEEDFQVTLRFDDYVVDSRQSPVTVLSREGSMNPWGIGHMINHPPSGTLPNCQSTMIDYTVRMELGDLLRYVPNAYARRPGWQSSFFDLEATAMHGMGYIARRDVCNEELVYDYRLQSDVTPDWYDIVEYSSGVGRSGDSDGGSEKKGAGSSVAGDLMMEKEQVVFFRDDWMNKG